MKPSPLSFQRLANRLHSLGAALVKEGPDVLMVYERDEGYLSLPRGKRYPLKIRPAEQVVPLLEIDKCLLHLGFSANEFWAINDGYLDSGQPNKANDSSTKIVKAGVLLPVPVLICPSCDTPMPGGVCLNCRPRV